MAELLLLAPASLLGVSLGVHLNDLSPRWFINVLLSALLPHVCLATGRVDIGAEIIESDASQWLFRVWTLTLCCCWRPQACWEYRLEFR
jgi:hypothetical protein